MKRERERGRERERERETETERETEREHPILQVSVQFVCNVHSNTISKIIPHIIAVLS